MKEFATMFRHGKMWLALLICAAAFFAMVILLNDIVLIPGFSTIRLANGLPVPFGLLFGPAGALGVTIGNVAGDFYNNTLTLASIGGALGNFLFALIPYKIWEALRSKRNVSVPNIFGLKKLVWFLVLSALASAVCAAVVAVSIWLADGNAFFETLRIIFLNNIGGAFVIGIPLFLILPVIVGKTDMYWKREMRFDLF